MLLFLLSEEFVPVPADQVDELVRELRPVPGALSARARIERALSTRAAAVSLGRQESAAVLDALNARVEADGLDALGADLIYLRTAIEYELGVRDEHAPSA